MTAPALLNQPSKPQTAGAATGRSQKDRRYFDTFRDTHRHPTRHGGLFAGGRPWCGSREIAANRESVPVPPDGFVSGDLMQCEHVENDDRSCNRSATFASVWNAPWRPLAKYFRFNYGRKLITFAYAQMRMEEEQGLRQYFKAASKLGIQLNLRVEPGILPHPQIVSELGEPSRMMKIAEAAMAGDPWLLGFIDEPNPDLAEILGVHPTSGILTSSFASYSPPEQQERVEQIIAAPPNADLLQMLADMQHQMRAMQDQMNEQRDKKANQSAAIKKGMAARKQASPRSSQESVA